MWKNKITPVVMAGIIVITVSACGLEKLSKKKTGDLDFTVVAESEMPSQVHEIIEERKEDPFKVTYSDYEYTYIIVGYGKQQYDGYSITVKNIYETENSVCVKTEFEGPSEYSDAQTQSYPYIVIKIEYTDKNVVFDE